MKNPFRLSGAITSEPPPPPPQVGRHPRWSTVRGSVLGVLLLLTAAFLAMDLRSWRQAAREQTEALQQSRYALNTLLRQARSLREERDRNRAALDESQTAHQSLKAALSNLEQQHRQASEAQQRLETEMRAALESRDVTISQLAGKLTVNILDRVLFASGQAEIKEEGQNVLRQVALILDEFPDRQIQVIGHTDNVPISTARFPSNWELSAARALAAVRFLTEQAGVRPNRVGALAHGEFHPIADNATPEGRAQNRRIAIVVLPEIVTRETTHSGPHGVEQPQPLPAATGPSATGPSTP